MNGDLELVDERDCNMVGGHELIEMADQWGGTVFECERCGEVWVTA